MQASPRPTLARRAQQGEGEAGDVVAVRVRDERRGDGRVPLRAAVEEHVEAAHVEARAEHRAAVARERPPGRARERPLRAPEHAPRFHLHQP
jgi:hypothetical protein